MIVSAVTLLPRAGLADDAEGLAPAAGVNETPSTAGTVPSMTWK